MRIFLIVFCLLISSCGGSSSKVGSPYIDPSIPDDEITYCPTVSTEMKAGECRLLEQQMASLKSGTGTFQPPGEMTRGDTATVRFSVEPGEAKVPDPAVTGDGSSTHAEPVNVPVKIGRVMSAELSGAGFAITPTGEQIRDLGAANKASWSWTLTAQKEGDLPLYLTVKVKALDKNGKPTELDLFEANKVVSVDVTVTQWLGDRATEFTGLFSTLEGAIKALTALIAALAALYFAIKTFGKKPKAPKPPK